MRTTVIVCCYTAERWADLVAGVEALAAQTRPPDEVLLVVDHNPDLLAALRADPAFAGVDVVANTGPRGLSGARNTGVALATGDVVAFLDDDALPDTTWLERLTAPFADPAVAVVGGHVEPWWLEGRPRWFPGEFHWVVGCSWTGLPAAAAPVRNVIGASMAFRAEMLQGLGGFSHAIGRVGRNPVGCEETELCIRLRRVHPDAVVLYEPAAVVRHRVPGWRGTWRYYRQRCFAEGRSKAVVSRLAGADQGLASERTHAARTIPVGVVRAVRDGQFRRAAAIVAGLGITTAGFVRGALARATTVTEHGHEAANGRVGVHR